MMNGSAPYKLVIIGVGNSDRGDDGVGPALVARLIGQCEHICIDASTAPENVTGLVKRHRPRAVVFVDAVDMGLRAGEIRLMAPGELVGSGFSTHTGSLALVSEYLERETGARVHIVGVQPERLGPGDGLSDAVRRTLDVLCRMFARADYMLPPLARISHQSPPSTGRLVRNALEKAGE